MSLLRRPLLLLCSVLVGGAIDRRSVVSRHNPSLGLPVTPTSVLSLGNGAFAFNVGVLGLQSLNETYTWDLCTYADWAWHTSLPASFLSTYNFSTYATGVAGGGTRPVRYPTGYNSSKDAGAWLHNNPHRLPLAQVSLAWAGAADADAPLSLADVLAANQSLDAWTGEATSA